MKKLITVMLILMTILFASSCNKNDSKNNENTSSGETPTVENTNKFPHEDYKDNFYQKIDIETSNMDPNFLSKVIWIYTSYDELVLEIEEENLQKANVSEEIFDENYLLYIGERYYPLDLGYYFSQCLVGYKNCTYDNGTLYMDVYGEYAALDRPEGVYFEYSKHFVVIPKESFPENFEKDPYLRFTYIVVDVRPIEEYYKP